MSILSRLGRLIGRRETAPVPRRIWRRGDKYNALELWQQPDGSRIWLVHRLYAPKCPRCLERNYSSWQWTVPFEDNVDPCSRIKDKPLSYRCARCRDVQEFTPEIGPSEWYQYR